MSPAEMGRFRLIEGAFRQSCLAGGYREIRTPTLEYLHLFTSTGTLTPGTLGKVYSFLDWDGWSGERVVLRPDATIPVARSYVEAMPADELARLFYVANIFIFEDTGEETRERWQCGVELIGAGSKVADVELITLALDALGRLGIEGVELRLSHAGLIKAMLSRLGLTPEEQAQLFDQILDGDAAALTKLSTLAPSLGDSLAPLLDLTGQSPGFLRNLKSLFASDLPEFAPALDDFISIVDLLDALGVGYRIDIPSGHGFEYYTGVMFQILKNDVRLAGGGRYDALIPLMGGPQVPASGFALYADHLMNLIPPATLDNHLAERVIISQDDGDAQSVKEGFTLAASLREAGFAAELALGGAKPPPSSGAIVGAKASSTIRIALPKGRLLEDTAAVLDRAGWQMDGYTPSLGNYRLESGRFSGLQAKVFNERDVPVQVAIGNYDLGICGLDWVEELSVKFPNSAVVKLKDLGYASANLYLASSRAQPSELPSAGGSDDAVIRIATEYPNLAEHLALQLRLRRFNVFPLWGSAEAYPPENAAFALVSRRSEEELAAEGLVAVRKLLPYGACLIANRDSWEQKDLSEILSSLNGHIPATKSSPPPVTITDPGRPWRTDADTVRLALPDGHQQKPTAALLKKAGIIVEDYPSSTGNRRPSMAGEGFVIKVIRPQDMPLQVANGNFDLAITGQDWLWDHRITFPSSPATHLVNLRSATIRMVAVVGNAVEADDIAGLRKLVAERTEPFRVASEYIAIADKYARDNHLGRYKVVPTWGATEAFLPEDADMLIENTETGGAIRRHNLKIIDTLFQSSGCLIGNRDAIDSPVKQERMDAIAAKLSAVVEED